ncbi:MAG: hypothetical protein RDV48_11325 [Candidatus Eremiobacteraeota bacterium]|nr:hypothetical protein [Candidatus Eremiobacteraeota bacterium]
MAERVEKLLMMFSGGTDTTLAASRILESNECDRLYLVTFCNGICVRVDRSKIHADELIARYGADRVSHEIIYVTEIFHQIRSPLRELITRYGSTLVFDLCCRLSMETMAIIYSRSHGIRHVCDGTNIDQGRLFLERPEYLRISKEFYGTYGISYFSPVYAKSGGRLGRRDELVKQGFTVGPAFLENLNISCCLFQQPFCLMAFHTFFFTSFLSRLPLLSGVIKKFNLPLEKAMKLRIDRQQIAHRIIREREEFDKAGFESGSVRIQEHFCTTKLCGQNTIEIAFPRDTVIDTAILGKELSSKGKVTMEGTMLRLRTDGLDMVVFPSGRVLIEGTRDRSRAVSLYERLLAPLEVFSRPGAEKAAGLQAPAIEDSWHTIP